MTKYINYHDDNKSVTKKRENNILDKIIPKKKKDDNI